MFRSNDKLFYVHPFQYSAYEVIGYDSLLLRYTFDFGDYTAPRGFYEAEPEKTAQKLLDFPYVMGVSSFHEIQSGEVMFNFAMKSDTYWGLYVHDSGKLIIKNTSDVKFTSEAFFLIPKAAFKNQLITHFSYDDLLFYESIGFVNEWDPKDSILNQLKTMGPNSNPVVMIAELK